MIKMQANVAITLFVAALALCSFKINHTADARTTSSLEVISEIDNERADEKPYYKGFKDGWAEGWKDVKGKYSYPPHAPYPSYPRYPASVDSYKDGYNAGFKAGMKRAHKS